MSIARQIQAFLEVSEAFLRQSAVATLSEGWPSVAAVSGVHSAPMSEMSLLLTRGVTVKSASGGNGHQGGGVMQAHRQDGI